MPKLLVLNKEPIYTVANNLDDIDARISFQNKKNMRIYKGIQRRNRKLHK